LVSLKRPKEASNMSKIIDAVYEDGILKPLSTPHLKNHTRVRLIIEEIESVAKSTSGIIIPRRGDVVDEIALESDFLPEEV